MDMEAGATPQLMPEAPQFECSHLFRSLFMGGFEGSSHRRRDGRQLDLIGATRHDAFVAADYRMLTACGIYTTRDALRWHLIEASPGRYDWSSLLPMLEAARQEGMQVIWDLCHYGLPHDIDIWSPDFVTRFADFAAAAARVVGEQTNGRPFYCPVNEMSFWAWAGGDHAVMYPMARDSGAALKRQLVRACGRSPRPICPARAADQRRSDAWRAGRQRGRRGAPPRAVRGFRHARRPSMP
jgi:hypothetical protein